MAFSITPKNDDAAAERLMEGIKVLLGAGRGVKHNGSAKPKVALPQNRATFPSTTLKALNFTRQVKKEGLVQVHTHINADRALSLPVAISTIALSSSSTDGSVGNFAGAMTSRMGQLTNLQKAMAIIFT